MSYESVEQAALALADQALPSEQLPAIANQFPALRAAVAAHPSAYPTLLDWLDGLGDDAVCAAVARKRAIHAALAASAAAPRAARVESASEPEPAANQPPEHAMREEPADVAQVVPQPEVQQPEVQQPEVQQPEVLQPDVPQPEVQPPPQWVPQPAVQQPQPPQPQAPQPEVPQPQAPQPQPPQQWVPQPEVQQPQAQQSEMPPTQVQQPQVLQPQPWGPQPEAPQPQMSQPQVPQPEAQLAPEAIAVQPWGQQPGAAPVPDVIQPSTPQQAAPPQAAPPSGTNQPPDGSGATAHHPASSPARVIGGILIALAGVASLVASFVVLPALKDFGFQTIGTIPGLTSWFYGTGISTTQTVWMISAIIVGVVWIGLGVFMAIAPRRLTLTAILALIAVTLFVFVPAMEMWVTFLTATGTSVTSAMYLLGAFLALVAICVALVLLIPATRAAATGKPFTGLKVAAIVLLALAIGYHTYAALITMQLLGTGSLTGLLTITVIGLMWQVGLLLFAIGVKARRVDAPPSDQPAEVMPAQVLPSAG